MSLFDFSEMKKKFSSLLYDVSIGLVKQYQKTAVDIAKIQAASFYIKLIRAVRQHTLFFALVFFGMIVYSNLMMVLEIAVLFYAPWPVAGKVLASIALGLLGFMAPLYFILRFFSEERWMKVTKAGEWVEDALKSNGSE